ncbi:hypothetical protein [Vulcanisaeta sp. JCM 16161]|uniref:hypothetical protein n=1 Tax=Vulcanisaeta sp. JCM 16161 TaxID=1295372 RepID=UPI0006D1ACD9|nr:hypothetical protein [Vulcanisaeta sp. JCM 16161]
MASANTNNWGIEEGVGGAYSAVNAPGPNTLSEVEQAFIAGLARDYVRRHGMDSGALGYVTSEFLSAYSLLKDLDAKRAPDAKFSIFIEVARARDALWGFVDSRAVRPMPW